MSRRQTHRLVLITSLVAGASPSAVAQGPVAVGQTVELLSYQGLTGPTVKLRGSLVQAGPDSVTVRASGGDRRVPLADVAGLKVRRMERQTLLGASLGMAAGWLITNRDPEPSLATLASAAAVGAGLGMLVKLPRYKTTPVSELRPDPLPGTLVRVQGPSGSVTGALVEAGPEHVIVETADHERVMIPRQEVTTTAWRSGKGSPSVVPPIVLGAVGLIVGLAVANEAACLPDDWFCMPGMETTLTGMTGFAIGTVIGTGISLMRPRPWRWEKAPTPAPRLALGPAAGGGVLVGVSQMIRFR